MNIYQSTIVIQNSTPLQPVKYYTQYNIFLRWLQLRVNQTEKLPIKQNVKLERNKTLKHKLQIQKATDYAKTLCILINHTEFKANSV